MEIQLESEKDTVDVCFNCKICGSDDISIVLFDGDDSFIDVRCNSCNEEDRIYFK